MSNIYIQEPPTNGKVMLETTVGDIDIELWSKEAPKACRNFVQLCMEGYYDGTIFHRVVKDFIVQGGDPTGTGHGGESIYGQPFKDEIHSRLRFVRRGLVAMANAGPNDNGSQFFFTMGPTQELQGKHTVFGKVTGKTVYNILKLQECDIGQNERPTYPNKIKKTQILSNPFDDIIPRVKDSDKGGQEGDKSKNKSKATKNFSLLSFGEEAEEDEEEVEMATKDLKGKSKSSHDLTNDPKLSSVPAVNADAAKKTKKSDRVDKANEEENDTESDDDDDDEEEKDNDEDNDENKAKVKESIRKKLEDTNSKKNIEKQSENSSPKPLSRSEELRREVHQLKKELRQKEKEKSTAKAKQDVKESQPENDVVAAYKAEKQKYVIIKKEQSKKGSSREEMTLAILSKFKTKLKSASLLGGSYDDDEEEEEMEETKQEEEGETKEEDDIGDMSWMRHKLQFEDDKKRKVIDANITDMDRYEIFDPRNPLTKRRREASKQTMKDKR